jgi:hypothetical protein
MSFHRATLVALATLFTVGMTSLASAGCCDWGASAPVGYGCGGGGCGAPVVTALSYSVPVAPAPSYGCGGCGAPMAAVVYAQPVAPAPIVTSTWAGCGCNRGLFSAASSPLYVVNQGPQYSGPGLMVPYQTYSQEAAYAPAVDYPYVSPYESGYGYGAGYGYGYRHRSYYGQPYYHGPGPGFGYRSHAYFRPHYYAPAARYYGPGPRYYSRPHGSWRG